MGTLTMNPGMGADGAAVVPLGHHLHVGRSEPQESGHHAAPAGETPSA